ncbi:hypothetical protein SAMN04488505_107160 [Chitinophaga rupis]|uniref:Uncharacterized protein n=1 Tax=Chitinophaga rupis TaxID=573321 RepID=A0A1H8CKP9_9BACT|nr:hypothetical protein SAMN04488505_107160 [Chitinophaga rupis]
MDESEDQPYLVNYELLITNYEWIKAKTSLSRLITNDQLAPSKAGNAIKKNYDYL